MPEHQKQITAELNTFSFSVEINNSRTVITRRILQYTCYVFLLEQYI